MLSEKINNGLNSVFMSRFNSLVNVPLEIILFQLTMEVKQSEDGSRRG
jgi:hypothetical protein